jgi:hypothetical protein
MVGRLLPVQNTVGLDVALEARGSVARQATQPRRLNRIAKTRSSVMQPYLETVVL